MPAAAVPAPLVLGSAGRSTGTSYRDGKEPLEDSLQPAAGQATAAHASSKRPVLLSSG